MLVAFIVSSVLTGGGLTLVSIFNSRAKYTDDYLGVLVPSGTVGFISGVISGMLCPWVVGTCLGFLALAGWAIVAIVALCASQYVKSHRS